MSTRDGRIIDVRYYVGDHGHLDASVYRSLKFAEWVGDRITRKAREYELRLGKRDHVYIYLRDQPPFGSVTQAPRQLSQPDFCHRIEAHLDPTGLDALTETEREDVLADLTLRALAVAVDHDAGSVAVIERVRSDLATQRRNLGVLWYTHETKRYRVRVMHHLTPMVQGSLAPIWPSRKFYAVLWFEDRLTGFCGSKTFLEFCGYEDLHAAIGSVSLKGDRVVVQPHRGHDHEAVIEVPLAELTPATAANIGPRDAGEG